ncbi:Chromosome partition protein Smc [Rosistilla carotiformis]|uniref:Chromosome partition protein Smc n=1 Tax=Rosistilla carotiformis TaxID=2528017 RepID=A0A518JQJ9_9BACT|nr:hypothetical protein [Rosistilla carotiformis]QDV67813.1 Chromosome partition protein Smc [Rosistilla carotiformis]
MTTIYRALATLLLVPLAACTAQAQSQALAQGERVISVGPVIPPKPVKADATKRLPSPPCTVDCEKAAARAADAGETSTTLGQSVLEIKAPRNSDGTVTPDSDAPKLPAPRDREAALREEYAKFQQDLNEANQKIDRLSKQLQLSEQRAAKNSASAPLVQQLEAKLAEMRKTHAEEIAAADTRLKVLVDEISVGLGSTRKEMDARELAMKKKIAAAAEDHEAAKKAFAVQMNEIKAALVSKSDELAKHAERAKVHLKQAQATQTQAAKAQQEFSQRLQAMAKQVEAAEQQAQMRELRSKELETQRDMLREQLDQVMEKAGDMQKRQKALEHELAETKDELKSARATQKKRKPKKKRDEK